MARLPGWLVLSDMHVLVVLEHWHSSGSGGEVECKCLDGVASPFSGAQRAVFLVLWSHRDDGKNASSPRRLRGSERALNM